MKSKLDDRNHGIKFDIEREVKKRYAKGAQVKERALCCPVSYDSKYLSVIPREILEKDYGCGDPSQFIQPGETVLDLGCGSGKICYITSQIVGPHGKVIGIDFNPAMLQLAKKHQRKTASRIGWDNVTFLRSNIDDLNIKSGTVDTVISSCVFNLVPYEQRHQLFRQMHRVLKKGGQAVISDIVSDETVPIELKQDPRLWSGCISGAFQETEFLSTFEKAGFYGIRIEKRDEKPWQTVKGIEFRSITVIASKGKEGPCWERNQAVIYKGPWKQVVDDDGHVLKRGVRTAVCDKTFHLYAKAPYQNELILVPPAQDIPFSKAKPFDCHRSSERTPRETKGLRYKKTSNGVCNNVACC